MAEWLDEHLKSVVWLAAFSVGVLVVSLAAVGLVLVRLPANYFVDRGHRSPKEVSLAAGLVRLVIRAAKNVLGWTLIFIGVIMLVAPGPGLLVGLIGIMLAEFPGKYTLERWIVSRKGVLSSINGVRRRFGRPPLEVGDRGSGAV